MPASCRDMSIANKIATHVGMRVEPLFALVMFAADDRVSYPNSCEFRCKKRSVVALSPPFLEVSISIGSVFLPSLLAALDSGGL